MKFAVSIITLYAAAALAGATERVEDIEPFEDAELSDNMEPFNTTGFDDDEFSEDVFGLEKRRGCTGHRKTTDVCQGNFIAKMPSRHNCYRRNGHCCAKNKNRDGGITISNKSQNGEDCMYCFSGRCKGGA